MTRLRFSLVSITATNNLWLCDGTITITVDGSALTAVPLGIFGNLYGSGPTCGNSATNSTGVTPAFAVTDLGTTDWAGEHKLMVPYTSSLSIAYQSAGGSTGTAKVYSNVDYYTGTAAVGIYPSTDKVFHLNLISISTTVLHYASIDLLPQITGAGRLRSIQLYVENNSTTNIDFLEGILPIYLDGIPWGTNGTEDTFCGSFYFATVKGFFGGRSCGTTALGALAGSGHFAASMFRVFDEEPLVFASTLKVTWYNGMLSAASDPGTSKVAALVMYYTTI